MLCCLLCPRTRRQPEEKLKKAPVGAARAVLRIFFSPAEKASRRASKATVQKLSNSGNARAQIFPHSTVKPRVSLKMPAGKIRAKQIFLQLPAMPVACLFGCIRWIIKKSPCRQEGANGHSLKRRPRPQLMPMGSAGKIEKKKPNRTIQRTNTIKQRVEISTLR